MEIKAYIYNDEKGEDISITDIPEDMKDDAELYRTELGREDLRAGRRF